ncbi:hypothetical protein VPNG_09259 [Cytospora leucostoma]|uniref:FAD-binding domain-containing protein n=1 Tax=Cytospora leucostoma TaxID=1230097 RepID=A0A423W0J9_9PEZI|nr:hypothetical protein VPNG_09259 [Cytospora leucostoma]
MAPLKVLIVGGGIAGPALAFWLHKLDGDITIVERAPALRATGQQIDLRGEGITIIRRMGLESAVRAKIVDEQGFQFIDTKGDVKAFIQANKTGQGKQSVTAEFELMRRDIVEILYDAAKDKCKYVFGTTIEEVSQRGDGVHVRFSDGSEGDFDLVVGADGQSSRTRRRTWGPDAEDPFHFLNLYLAYFTVPNIADQGAKMFKWLPLPGRRGVMTRNDNRKTQQVYLGHFNPDHKELEASLRTGDVRKQKEVWAELLGDAGWEVPRFLDAMLSDPLADDFFFQRIGQVRLDKWYRGRVVLIGDAAYCPSPLTGKGTSLAIIGAYVLAGELSEHLGSGADRGEAVDAALASYDRTFRPCVEKAHEIPLGAPGILYPETSWGIWFLQLIVGLLVMLRIDKIFERFTSDNVGGEWQLPDYPELK